MVIEIVGRPRAGLAFEPYGILASLESFKCVMRSRARDGSTRLDLVHLRDSRKLHVGYCFAHGNRVAIDGVHPAGSSFRARFMRGTRGFHDAGVVTDLDTPGVWRRAERELRWRTNA